MERRIQQQPEAFLQDMGWVFGLARSLVGDAATAEDVTQDTLVAALGRSPSEGPPPRRWLAAVVRNFARQRARSEATRARREKTVARSEDLPSADALVQRMENQRLLAAAVTRLPEPYRSTIILRYSEDLAPVDIARRLGLPAGTVRRRLKEGLDRLRADLDRHFGGKRHAWIAAFQPFVGGGQAPAEGVAAAGVAVSGGLLVMKTFAIGALTLACALGVWLLFEEFGGAVSEGRPVAVGDAGSGLNVDAEPRAQQAGGEQTVDGEEPRREVATPAGAAATVVTGHVVLPADAPEDPTLEVFAAREAIDNIDLVYFLDAPDGVGPIGFEHKIVARGPVQPDGTFRIAFPPDLAVGYLALRGRYLYTAVAESVALERGDRAATLTPMAGAWVTGRLLASDLTKPETTAGIPVSFVPFSNVPPTSGIDWRVFGSQQRTRADGTFEFRAVPPHSDYLFTAIPELLEAHSSEWRGLEALRRTEFTVTLGSGGTVRGTVVDATGHVAAKATVEARLPGHMFGIDDQWVRRTETDARGEFVLERVPGRGIVLLARKQGHLESARQRVSVQEGAIVEGISIALGRGKTITGIVQWPDDVPAATVHVRAVFDRSYQTGGASLQAARGGAGAAKTDGEGRFRITGLGAGPFVVSVDARPSEQRAKMLGIVDAASPPTFHAQADAVEPRAEKDAGQPRDPAAERGEIGLVLRAPQAISGVVVGQRDQPVKRFRIHAARVVQGALGEMSIDRRALTVSSETGEFRMDGLSSGRWQVSAEFHDIATAEPVTVTLPRPPEAAQLVIRTVAAASVSGVVLSPAGNPQAGAVVHVDAGRPTWMSRVMASPLTPEARTDAQGRFELQGLMPGQVSLFADSEVTSRGPAQAFVLHPGQRIDSVQLQLREGGTLVGHVHGEEGKPATKRLIHIESVSGEKAVGHTDPLGNFVFERLEAGTWAIGAVDPSTVRFAAEQLNMGEVYASAIFASAEVVDGETVRVEMGKPDVGAVRVRGTVTKGGEPYANATITFMPSGGSSFDRMKMKGTDAEGRYDLEVDAPGMFDVMLARYPKKADDENNTVNFLREIPMVAEHRLDLQMPGGQVEGRVFGPDGAALAGVRVALYGDGRGDRNEFDAGAYVEVLTERDGRYVLPSLRAGEYVMAAGGAPHEPGNGVAFARQFRADVLIGTDETLRGVDFRLKASRQVVVEVVDAAGKPAVGATVFARDAAGNVVDVLSVQMTDTRGRCLYQGLGDREYSFFAKTWEQASAMSAPCLATASQDVSVRLVMGPGTRVRVRLRDASGRPVSGWVQPFDEKGNEIALGFAMANIVKLLGTAAFSTTDPLFGPLPPGKYRVEAEGLDGSKASGNVSLDGAAEAELVLRFGR